MEQHAVNAKIVGSFILQRAMNKFATKNAIQVLKNK